LAVVPPSGPGGHVSNLVKDANLRRSGHNGRVKFRIATAVAFGLGYTLGTKAGRERYNQIKKVTGQVTHSAPVAGSIGMVGDKAKAAATLGVERARDAVSSRLGWRDGDDAADAIAATMANDVASALNGHRAAKPRH
jgi:hypothetical protein